MPVLPRKAAAPAATAAPINFGDLSLYTAGGVLPEGDYIWSNLQFQLYQAKNKQTGQDVGPARLGVMITLKNLTDPAAEEKTQFYSLGRNAHLSAMPDADTGTTLLPVPGGPAVSFNNSTNWAVLLESLYNSGLPEGVLSNDISVLNGIWVHMTNVPEPESRKNMQQTGTAEVAQAPRTPSMIAVVSEIKDDGKPWEGTGGEPQAAKPGPRAVTTKPPVKAAAPAARPAPAAAPAKAAVAEATGFSDEDVMDACITVLGGLFEDKPNGASKPVVRTETLKRAKATYGDEMAQAIIATFFGDDESLGAMVGQHGYVISGPMIKPAA